MKANGDLEKVKNVTHFGRDVTRKNHKRIQRLDVVK